MGKPLGLTRWICVLCLLADDRGRVYYVSCGEAEGYYPLGLLQQWIAEAFAVETWIEQK